MKQSPVDIAQGPDPAKPFYRVHELFPNLNGKSMPDVGWRLGLAPGLGINYHNSAVQVLANGDVVAAYYNTPDNEDDPDQTVMVMRRRAGAEDWDMPEPWPDFADAACAAPVFWNDQRAGISGSSSVSRASSARRPSPSPLPMTTAQLGRPFSSPTSPRPSAATSRSPSTPSSRAKNGTIYIPTDSTGRDADGNGSISASGPRATTARTWYDTGGRTAGRHTTIVMANNGDILGFGGKNSEHRWPHAARHQFRRRQNLGEVKTIFDPLASGERPSVIRLASGRLFFVADFNPKHEKHIHKDGAYVALSDDDGKTWKQKRLPADILTVGYVTATQGPDGVIHIVTSKNTVNYEIELNEAWV